MLESIRKRTNSIYVLLIFGVIIVVFIFWGVGPGGDKVQKDYVASVNGEGITVRDFQNVYRNQLEYYRNNLGEGFTEETAEKLDLKHRAVDILVNRLLAIQAAEKEGIEVFADEVQQAIASMPAFAEDGKFSFEQYDRVLKANRIMPQDFEESVKYDILTSKMREHVTSGVTVNEEELKETFSKEFRKVNLEYVEVGWKSLLKSVKLTEEDARAYLSEHKDDFILPVQVRAFYAHADFDEMAGLIEVTDSDVKAFYEANRARFTKPEEIRARHILIRPDHEAADREGAEAEAKKEAEQIHEMLARGDDFAKLALKLSADPGSASKGGDLGWFSRGVMIKPFEETAFALEKGEVSGVVKTEFGYHIIKLEERKAAEPIPLDEAAPEIRKELKRDMAREKALDVISGMKDRLVEAPGVEELRMVAQGQKGVRFATTGLFTEESPDKIFAIDDRLLDTVFYMLEGRVSNAIETNRGVYIIKLIERIEPHTPPFEDIKDAVTATAREARAVEMASEKASEILAAAKDGAGLGGAAAKAGLKPAETGFFSFADGFVPKIGLFVGENQGLYDLTPDAPLLPEVAGKDDTFYVIALKDGKPADEALYPKVKDGLREKLLAIKREAALQAWIDERRAASEIKLFEDLLQ